MTEAKVPAAKKHFLHPENFSKKRFWLTSLVLVLAGTVFGVCIYFYSKTHVSTDDAYVEAHVIPISPKVAAHVLKVLVDDNQEVKEGDLLVQLDERDYQTRFKAVRAELEGVEAEEAQASEDALRYQKLLANDELSKQQLDKAQLRLRNAQAQVSKDKANQEQAELQLSYTKITAPSDGRVTRKSVEAGAYVQTGQALMAIVTPERWVVANFKETQLTHMSSGQEAHLKIDAYPQKKYKGHVDSIQRGTGAKFSLLPAENATGNFIKVTQRVPVKIVLDEVPDSDHPVVPGMSVEVTVKTA